MQQHMGKQMDRYQNERQLICHLVSFMFMINRVSVDEQISSDFQA